MDAHLIDSEIFGHQWATEESRGIFAERARLRRWVEILAALAAAQAECGIIPAAAVQPIVALVDQDLPIAEIACRTRETGHSTLGMIQVLKALLPEASAEFVYYGATVQDITDTSQVLELRSAGALIWRDLWRIEADLLRLVRQFRDTPMAGRTHGQVGSPISFGFKVAIWADEVGRHLQRLQQGRDRWLVGQLAGAVGSLAFFGDKALVLRGAFCRQLGLKAPEISWTNSRDRLAEFASVLAMISGTLSRIAGEVFTLQRSEIGELAEKTSATTVGSITMPHKRNPEVSEQIVALGRLVRSGAAVLTETMLQEHERDARGWKVEWATFPELCHFALAATSMTRVLVDGLEVFPDRMLANLGAQHGSERLLSRMSVRLGKHQAQDLLKSAYAEARQTGKSVRSLLQGLASDEELAEFDRVDLGAAPAMVDRIVTVANQRREGETEAWT